MEVLKRGFEILKTRPLNDKLDIVFWEKEYNVIIPSNYRLFSELFYLSIDLNDNDLEVKYLSEENHLGDEIYFDNLFSLEFCLSSYEEYEFWYEKVYKQIGDGHQMVEFCSVCRVMIEIVLSIIMAINM